MFLLNGIARAQSAKDTITLPPAQPQQEKATELKKVTVTAQKPYLEQKADRVIVHVEALISNTGTNALEVLGNIPGLEVDDYGGINLKGRAGVRIWIDGIPSQLSGAELANYLQSLPSGVLDKIEIMSNPPASYGAAGTAGIINIITKKYKTKGLSASITGNLGAGVYGSSNNSIVFNYRHDKLTLSGSIPVSVLNNYFQSDRVRSYTNPDGSPNGALEQHFYEHSNRVSSGGEVTFNYACTKNTSLDVAVSGSAGSYDERGHYRSRYLHTGGALDSSMIVISHLWNIPKDGNIDINLRHTFDTSGKAFTAGLHYSINQRDQHQLMTTTIYGSGNALKEMDDWRPGQTLHIDTYTANADYRYPLARDMKIETGWQSIFSHVSNLSAYATQVYNNPADDSAWSGRFLFAETIHAVYGSITRDWDNFSLQAGLRLENTVSTGHDQGNTQQADTSFTRRYTDLFPTAYFTYKTDHQCTHQWLLSLGRRINRPDYESLNPSPFYFDRSTIYTGNPYLKPEFSYNSELSYVYKQNLTATLLYSDSRDLIMQTFQQQGNLFVAMPANIGRVITGGMSIGAAIPVTRWWKGVVYTEWYNNHYRSSGAAGERVNPNGHSWRVSVNHQFRLGSGWNAEISGFYRMRSVQAQSIVQPLWYMNTTLQKKLWNDKWVVNLGWRDVFHSKIYKRELNTLAGQTVRFVNVQDTRVVSLSLTYKFSKNSSNESGERAEDSKAAIRRLRNSN